MAKDNTVLYLALAGVAAFVFFRPAGTVAAPGTISVLPGSTGVTSIPGSPLASVNTGLITQGAGLLSSLFGGSSTNVNANTSNAAANQINNNAQTQAAAAQLIAAQNAQTLAANQASNNSAAIVSNETFANTTLNDSIFDDSSDDTFV